MGTGGTEKKCMFSAFIAVCVLCLSSLSRRRSRAAGSSSPPPRVPFSVGASTSASCVKSTYSVIVKLYGFPSKFGSKSSDGKLFLIQRCLRYGTVIISLEHQNSSFHRNKEAWELNDSSLILMQALARAWYRIHPNSPDAFLEMREGGREGVGVGGG